MKLTDQHIDELFKFTRQHYVEHYDLQSELVDHLANDIEAIWKEQPTLSFEQARDISFKKFGIFGFMDVVEKRTVALEKKYWKMVWAIFKDFFKLPQFILTVAITVGVYEILSVFKYEYTIAVLGVACFVVLIIRLAILSFEKKKRFKKTNKKWLLEEHIYKLGNGELFLNLVLQIMLRGSNLSSEWVVLFYTVLFTALILVIYIIAFVLPSKVEEILAKEHPEYLFVTNQ
ncbi:MAG: hypothetical protein COB73_01030 [Flavobacteriaceae bacterium]|nr:MAG: hypothetical protein COB73_01030 [Flavobacteriaceae bacterium]